MYCHYLTTNSLNCNFLVTIQIISSWILATATVCPCPNYFNIIYFNLTSQYITIVFKSVVWKKGDESFRINAVLGLGVGSNPGPLAPESCVLPCASLHIHLKAITYNFYNYYSLSYLISFTKKSENVIDLESLLESPRKISTENSDDSNRFVFKNGQI